MHEEYWVTRDYGREGKAVNMSKASLGDFMLAVFKHDGRVTSSYCMNAKYPRSYCQFGIALPVGKKEEFEADSGFTLEAPPQLALA